MIRVGRAVTVWHNVNRRGQRTAGTENCQYMSNELYCTVLFTRHRGSSLLLEYFHLGHTILFTFNTFNNEVYYKSSSVVATLSFSTLSGDTLLSVFEQQPGPGRNSSLKSFISFENVKSTAKTGGEVLKSEGVAG